MSTPVIIFKWVQYIDEYRLIHDELSAQRSKRSAFIPEYTQTIQQAAPDGFGFSMVKLRRSWREQL